jgi:hypothetical protein
MTTLLIIKCVLTGLLGALAMYTFLGLLFMQFPMPELMGYRRLWSRWAARVMVRNASRGERIWRLGTWSFRAMGWVIALGSMPLYALMLHWWMRQYMAIPAEHFLQAYLVAVIPPMPLIVLVAMYLIRNRTKTPLFLD